MFWGAGPTLGLLTFCGYLLFLFGAVLVWRNRNNFLLWIQDEISFFQRKKLFRLRHTRCALGTGSFSRYTPAGPFYIPRSDSRFKSVPHYLLNSLSRLSETRINGGAVLLLVGLLLFLLDFYI